MARIRVIDAEEAPDSPSPVCPHCERTIDALVRGRLDEGLGKAYVWTCPGCHEVLGVSHRKGFWMG